MRKVYSSSYIADCDQLRVALSLAGIDSVMKNEYGNPVGLVIIGGVADFAAPEIWVEEADYEEAVEIVKTMGPAASKPAEQTGAVWTCPTCGEIIEEPMNACWKCETERPAARGL